MQRPQPILRKEAKAAIALSCIFGGPATPDEGRPLLFHRAAEPVAVGVVARLEADDPVRVLQQAGGMTKRSHRALKVDWCTHLAETPCLAGCPQEDRRTSGFRRHIERDTINPTC